MHEEEDDVDDMQFEQALTRLLLADFSAGTETFRDELLARCLAVLNADVHGATAETDADCRIIELDDADLELLAAAGDAMGVGEPLPPGNGENAFGYPTSPNA